jgi:AraC-like DNA-binding protein
VAEGARDLTELALDLGYADHSHFTNFRHDWGLPPSRFRALVGHRKPSKNLQAAGPQARLDSGTTD